MATAHRWWHRWLEADAAQRSSGDWLQDRSSGRIASRGAWARTLEARICAVRQTTGWGPRLVAGATGQPHQTVWKVLLRHGFSAGRAGARGARIATSGPAPATAAHGRLHLPALPAARASRDRRPLPTRPALDGPRPRVGNDYAHAIVDDHTRLAYVELHDDERAATVTAFFERALAFFAGHGITAAG